MTSDDQREALRRSESLARDALQRSQEQLAHRAEFQRVLMNLAVRFVNAPLESLDAEIDHALAEVGAFSASDRAYLFAYDFAAGTTSNTHEWCGPGVEPMIAELQDVPLDGLDDWMDAHCSRRAMHVPSVPDLPPGSALRQILEPQGILTLITVPLWHDGECLGFVGFDAVTHLKDWTADETALLDVLAELFTNAWIRRDRERALVAAQRAAEEANQAKSRFLATMSHELRTPMNGVLGMTELLLASDLDARQAKFAHAVHRSGEQLLSLLNDILDVAKVESGRMELERASFDPRALTRDLVELAAPGARGKGLQIEAEVDPAVPGSLVGDQGRIRQVLSNLLGNAIKFTELGSVRVVLSDEGESDSGCAVCWRIIDTGPGIDPEILPRLFEPFAQADTSIARRYGGTGLGLTIVRELVDLMGGELEVDSQPGQGTTFAVTLGLPLPAARTAPQGSEVSDDADPPHPDGTAGVTGRTASMAGVRVLVAEDNTVNRMLAEAHLKALGCAPIMVEDGREALRAVASQPVDVILMDCRMPVMDGFEATRAIRSAEGDGTRVPIVALTANVMEDDREACLEAGMDGFLTKPYTRDELLAELTHWVSPRG